jgi:adenine-specific DNA-methyltransferase
MIRRQPTAQLAGGELILNRRARDLRLLAATIKKRRMAPLQVCEGAIEDRLLHHHARRFFSGLPSAEKHYWVSSLYALLMPEERRRQLAAYFTPPHLAEYAIDLLVEYGVRPGKDTILDPASGGAAFLVPLAARIADETRRHGGDAATILTKIETTLSGIEIDRDLASLSRALLSNLLRTELAAVRRTLDVQIRQADALKIKFPGSQYDAVIANPPYGRIYRPDAALLDHFAPVITDSYVNLYALFIGQALQWVRPGGIVCLIVPISFIGGPHFASLRQHILETARVVSLDPIDKRSEVFFDVLYDICVLVLQKKGGTSLSAPTTSSLFLMNESPRQLGQVDVPAFPSRRVWALPDGTHDQLLFQQGLETLEDYGYITKTGYFVWNREQHRYRTGFKPRASEVPLFWANNVKPNGRCEPVDNRRPSNRIGFVKIDPQNTGVVRSDAVILQRTSNRRQKRRLNAAVIRQAAVPGKRGFVSENHTILIIPDPHKRQSIPLKLLCRLLNTATVDARFRRISGTVSVSTKALRILPLPKACEVRTALALKVGDDAAIELAYARSVIEGETSAVADDEARH